MTNPSRLSPTVAVLALLAGLAAMPQPGLAQAWPPLEVEITPFVGYQSSLEFKEEGTGNVLELEETDNLGLFLDFTLTPDTQLEFLYLKSSKAPLRPDMGGAALADIGVEYLHVGGLLLFSQDKLRPYIGGGLGATHFSPDAPGMDGDTRFSLSFGGGVKYFLARNIGFRLDARAFLTQTDSDSAAFCVNGVCRIHYDGDFITQYTVSAGIIVGF